MSTKWLRKHLDLSGDIDDYARAKAEEEARGELEAIERACIDLFLHGRQGVSDASLEVLTDVGAFAHGETE